MKKSNDTIGNLTRDLWACSAVPQPTAPPRAPMYITISILYVRTVFQVPNNILQLMTSHRKMKVNCAHLPCYFTFKKITLSQVHHRELTDISILTTSQGDVSCLLLLFVENYNYDYGL